ncbi:hypothetical protein BC749_10947 [Flavobacterium araucananum]|nr:hypothetical protein [Flavobacterium araucananum]PWJ96771.1 hypothetical protein BC749_10947 [Flavobacterium araucananum]
MRKDKDQHDEKEVPNKSKKWQMVVKILKYALYVIVLYFAYQGFMAWK